MTSVLLTDLLERSAALWPAAEAIADPRGAVSYGALPDRARRTARVLRELAPGGRFAVLAGNRREVGELYWAAAYGGLTCVPINVRLAPPEVGAILRDAEVEAVVVDDEGAGRLPPTDLRVVALDPAFEHRVAAAAPFEAEARRPDDVVLQISTSGTTGVPKGACLTHANLLALAWSAAVEGVVVHGDRYLVPIPLCHVSGGNRFFSCCITGATVDTTPRFDPDDVLRRLAAGELTAMIVVPTALQALVEAADGRAETGRLRRIAYGAAPISRPLLEATLATFACELQQGYGLSETSGHATILSPDDHLARDTRRLSSAGRPAAGLRVRVVDEDGQDRPAGDPGEVLVRGGNVMHGYWRRPEETAAALRGGWLHTGDVGVLDEDGYLYLVDRRSDLLVSGGFNVYPREIEVVLHEHPAVLDCAVVGVAHPRWGEAPAAAVVLRPDAATAADEILAFCRERLAGYKLPSRIDFVDALPRNGVGKVDKRRLRRELARGVD